MKLAGSLLLAASLFGPIVACTDAADLYDGEQVKSDDGKADSSALATFLDAEFDASFVTDNVWDVNSAISDHALFTVGQLNGMTAVGRVDKIVTSNVVKSSSGGKTTISYHAKLPIAWGKRDSIPASIDLWLPIDFSDTAQAAFVTKYKANCVDFGAHDVDAGSMFYYFRPKNTGCKVEAADAVKTSATLSP